MGWIQDKLGPSEVQSREQEARLMWSWKRQELIAGFIEVCEAVVEASRLTIAGHRVVLPKQNSWVCILRLSVVRYGSILVISLAHQKFSHVGCNFPQYEPRRLSGMCLKRKWFFGIRSLPRSDAARHERQWVSVNVLIQVSRILFQRLATSWKEQDVRYSWSRYRQEQRGFKLGLAKLVQLPTVGTRHLYILRVLSALLRYGVVLVTMQTPTCRFIPAVANSFGLCKLI